MTKDKVLEVILKLKAVTEQDSGAFPGEMAVASTKIQELMAKYNISDYDLNVHRADKTKRAFSKAFTHASVERRYKKVEVWVWNLANIIADITGTRYYCMVGKRYGTSFKFFGKEGVAEMACSLFLDWYDIIYNMAKQAQNENRIRIQKAYGSITSPNIPWDENPRYYRASWLEGCIGEIRKSIDLQKKQNAEIGTAIQVYKAELDKRYEEFSIGFVKRNVGNRRSRGFNSSGYAEGQEIGSNISIGSKRIK